MRTTKDINGKYFDWMKFYFDNEHVQIKIYITWSDHKCWDFQSME